MKTCPFCLGQRFVLQLLQPVLPPPEAPPGCEAMALSTKAPLVGCCICGVVGKVPAAVAAAASVEEMARYGMAYGTN